MRRLRSKVDYDFEHKPIQTLFGMKVTCWNRRRPQRDPARFPDCAAVLIAMSEIVVGTLAQPLIGALIGGVSLGGQANSGGNS